MGTLTAGYFDQFSSTFLHHYVNVVSYWTNSTFKHGYFWSRVVSNETLQLSIELIALINQNKLPCSHFDISVSGGESKGIYTKRVCSACSLKSGKLRSKNLILDFKTTFFCGQVNVNKAALVWEKKQEGAIQTKKRNIWRLKLLELLSLKFSEN